MRLELEGAGSNSGELTNKVLAAFQRFDTNNDGAIDRDDLRKLLQTLDPKLWTDRKISRLQHALDTDRDGRTQYREFVQWACSEDKSEELKALRQVLDISREDAKAAPAHLPGAVVRRPRAPSANRAGVKPSSARSAPRSASVRKSFIRRKTTGDVGNEPLPRTKTDPELLQRIDTANELLANAEAPCDIFKDEVVKEEVPEERLIIFDFDGTITVDKDQKFKGLVGERLLRLKAMMAKIKASSTRCILVTAQFPSATQEITIPALQKTGLCGLFEDESLDSRLRLYWDDAEHGTIYNGAKAMMGKIDLIQSIMNGKNCWGKTFAPSNVFFIDDDSRNFRGHEKLGIQIRMVNQDGMVDEDMETVEAFARGEGKHD